MTQDKIKKYIAYSRVSTEKQKYDETIEIQKEKLREYDEIHSNIEIIEWLEDDGVSGEKDERGRPGYCKLKKLVKNIDVDGIICASLDRLGRSNYEHQKFFKEIIENAKKDLILLSHNLDTSTKEGKFAYDILCAQVEYDLRNIRERLKTGWHREYKINPEKFGRPKKELPEKLKDKIINWYRIQKHGFKIISRLILTENIKEYPDWFQRMYPEGFGKPEKKLNPKTNKTEKEKKFYLSPVTIGKRLKEWEIEIRTPKLKGSE